jgi:predicted peptidase
MMRFSWIVCVAVLLSAAAYARKAETGFLDRRVEVGGEKYRYQVFVPADWDRHKKWPVILFLHGAGERGSDGLLQTDVGLAHAIRQNASRWPFVVVMPQCWKDNVWTEAAMEEQALKALEQSIKEFHGDRERVYLTGLSMGGYGSWDLAAKHPDSFAAMVVVCGGIRPPGGLPTLHVDVPGTPDAADPYQVIAARVARIPIQIFHGADDPSVPVEEAREMAKALRDRGANVKYTEYVGVGHQSWDPAYAEPELPSWLLAQSLDR